MTAVSARAVYERPQPLDQARDLRKNATAPRSIEVLIAELRGLESLKHATPSTAPDYPFLVRRLAEDYTELSYARSANGEGASLPRKKAIAEYSILARSYPTTKRIDEVLYYLGYAYELDGDLTNARSTYSTLISCEPSSKYVPYAYYALGEMLREEAKSDPSKSQLALDAYLEALEFNGSAIEPWVLLRIGQTYDAAGDPENAEQMWAKLKRDFPQSPATARL